MQYYMLFSYGMKPGKEVSFILPVTTPVWSTQSTNIPSERGLAIIPLQQIFLIAAVLDIQILPFWLPFEENIVADAASRFDYKTLANLGLQVSPDLTCPN